jgi:alcohol dehydrogenase class IV
MPFPVTADMGVGALTQAVEAYVSRKADPFSDGLALNAIRTIGRQSDALAVDRLVEAQ